MDPTPFLTQSQQCLGTVDGTVRESIEEDKSEEVKKRLKKRGIPEDDWQYYIESPHSLDSFNGFQPGNGKEKTMHRKK